MKKLAALVVLMLVLGLAGSAMAKDNGSIDPFGSRPLRTMDNGSIDPF